MVGQHLAIEHPARVRSLTSIMSTPGARRYLPEPRALRALFMPAPRTAEAAGLRAETTFRILGSIGVADRCGEAAPGRRDPRFSAGYRPPASCAISPP